MRIKVDENIANGGVDLLRGSGHDVMTVREQGLAGSSDDGIFTACVNEGRTLVTLDRDFGQASRFPHRQTAGIVIIDPGDPVSLRLLLDRLRDFLALAATRPVEGELWIIEPGRARVRSDKSDQ